MDALRAYHNVNLLELPAGYDGEIGEAFSNLVEHGLTPTRKNIRLYLRAKASLIEYFRREGKSVTDAYSREIKESGIAGVILPEWVLALETVVTILSGGLTIAQILGKLLNRNVPSKETNIHGDAIIQIDEVKNLKLMVNQSRKRASKRKTKKRRR